MALQLPRASLMLFIFSFSLQTVCCLKCYACSHPPESGCGGVFDKSNITQVTCEEDQNVCIKMTGLAEGVKVYRRSCGKQTKDLDECADMMKMSKEAGNSDVNCLACSTDACNSSSTISMTFFFLLFTTLALYKIV